MILEHVKDYVQMEKLRAKTLGLNYKELIDAIEGAVSFDDMITILERKGVKYLHSSKIPFPMTRYTMFLKCAEMIERIKARP